MSFCCSIHSSHAATPVQPPHARNLTITSRSVTHDTLTFQETSACLFTSHRSLSDARIIISKSLSVMDLSRWICQNGRPTRLREYSRVWLSLFVNYISHGTEWPALKNRNTPDMDRPDRSCPSLLQRQSAGESDCSFHRRLFFQVFYSGLIGLRDGLWKEREGSR